MKKIFIAAATYVLLGCGPDLSETKDNINQQYSIMASSSESTYLKNVIYKEELKPLIPLINYINEKQNYNKTNLNKKPRPFTYSFNDRSIQSIINILKPLEGYYTQENCSILDKNEYAFLSPEVVAYYALKNSALDKDSLKAQALYSELESKIRSMSGDKFVRQWIEKVLTESGIKIESDWQAYKLQIKATMKKLLTETDTVKIFLNPKTVFCSNLTKEELEMIYKNFLDFDLAHKPLKFNEEFNKNGFYSDRE